MKDSHDLATSPEIFKNTSEISTVVSYGHSHILNKEFVSTTSWVAHVGGRVIHMAERKGVLVTIGEEDAVRGSLLRIWDFEKTDKRQCC
jgi:hypothetical protein